MLGVTTLILLAGAGFAWNGGDSGIAGLLARVGAVFAASWIAHPALVRLDRRTIWLLVVGGLVVLVRPRAAFVVLPVIAIFARTAQVREDPADR